MELPERGQSWDELSKGMEDAGKHDVAWRDGKAAVYVFNAGEDVSKVQREAYALYQAENGLGPAAFPSLKQMEADVVQMALRLLSAPEAAGGAMTSGGTDSITMAVKRPAMPLAPMVDRAFQYCAPVLGPFSFR